MPSFVKGSPGVGEPVTTCRITVVYLCAVGEGIGGVAAVGAAGDIAAVANIS